MEVRGSGDTEHQALWIVLNFAKTRHRWILGKISKCGYVYTVKSFHLYSIILLFVCLKTQLGLATIVRMVLIFLSYESRYSAVALMSALYFKWFIYFRL